MKIFNKLDLMFNLHVYIRAEKLDIFKQDIPY